MAWFQRLCRETGLMVHHIIKPVKSTPGGGKGTRKREVKRTVEEEQVSPSVTLRRTTIEEVEIKRTNEPD